MLSILIDDYIQLNRGLGRVFREQQRMLQLFSEYAKKFGDRHTNADRIIDWCKTASSPNVAKTRLDVLRRFCLYVHAEDQKHQVPSRGIFGQQKRPRPTPFIIEPEQLWAIMQAALEMPPAGKISSYTYHFLFGLLATTGLRVSEALGLQLEDFVPDGLIIRNGKFGKQRLLPIQPSTRAALNSYILRRKKLGAVGDDLFVTVRGRAPDKVRVYVVFVSLARKLGFRGPAGTKGMRLHDLRHTFAVRSLESCPRDREAVAHHVAALSSYLGHKDVASTYWYLEATTVLLQDIAMSGEKLYLGENS